MKRLCFWCILMLAISSFAAVDTVYVEELSKQEPVKEETILMNTHFVFASWNLYGEAIGIGYENLFHPKFAAQVMFNYYYTQGFINRVRTEQRAPFMQWICRSH